MSKRASTWRDDMERTKKRNMHTHSRENNECKRKQNNNDKNVCECWVCAWTKCMAKYRLVCYISGVASCRPSVQWLLHAGEKREHEFPLEYDQTIVISFSHFTLRGAVMIAVTFVALSFSIGFATSLHDDFSIWWLHSCMHASHTSYTNTWCTRILDGELIFHFFRLCYLESISSRCALCIARRDDFFSCKKHLKKIYKFPTHFAWNIHTQIETTFWVRANS